MLNYDNKNFLSIIFSFSGTVFYGIFWKCVFGAAVGTIAAVLDHFGIIGSDGDYLTSTGVSDFYTFLSLVMGLLLSFRISFAYNRWEEGVNTMGGLAQAARVLVSQCCCYIGREETNKSCSSPDKDRLASETLSRIRKLVVAACVTIMKHTQHQIAVDDLFKAGLITEQQFSALKNTTWIQSQQTTTPRRLPVKSRPALILNFIRQELYTAWQNQILDMQMFVVMSDKIDQLSLSFQTISRVTSTPMPFIYAHFIKVLVTFYVCVTPFGFAKDLHWLTPLASFFISIVMFGIDDIAVEIEEPFGGDANDIDIATRVLHIDLETASLVSYRQQQLLGEHWTPEQFNVSMYWKEHEWDNFATRSEKRRLLEARQLNTISETVPLLSRDHECPPSPPHPQSTFVSNSINLDIGGPNIQGGPSISRGPSLDDDTAELIPDHRHPSFNRRLSVTARSPR